MNSINHPKIHCLFDISKKMLDFLEIPFFDCKEPPIYDNLLQASVWPVYTEIADGYGIEGSYRFKPPASFKSLGLEEFIEGSVKIYKDIGIDNIEILGYSKRTAERLIDLIRS